MIEAKETAYADMRFVADPHFAKAGGGILSKDYAVGRAKLIDMQKQIATSRGPAAADGHGTTYLCVVDSEVTWFQATTIRSGRRCGQGTGFALQNRGGLFSLDQNHPNALAGRKRPLHTIIPAFMSKGDVRIAFGIMGGWNQSQAHAQFVSDLADHRMNIQAALEAARFTKQTFEGCDVDMESRIPETVRTELEARGHKIKVRGHFAEDVGGGQAVM
jgi:gamma-glutamyltranspeptidase/glutathione hydrolase